MLESPEPGLFGLNRVSFEDQIWLIESKRPGKWVLVAIMAKLIQLTNDKLAYTV